MDDLRNVIERQSRVDHAARPAMLCSGFLVRIAWLALPLPSLAQRAALPASRHMMRGELLASIGVAATPRQREASLQRARYRRLGAALRLSPLWIE